MDHFFTNIFKNLLIFQVTTLNIGASYNFHFPLKCQIKIIEDGRFLQMAEYKVSLQSGKNKGAQRLSFIKPSQALLSQACRFQRISNNLSNFCLFSNIFLFYLLLSTIIQKFTYTHTHTHSQSHTRTHIHTRTHMYIVFLLSFPPYWRLQ